MKVLTLTQPWATLVAIGAKKLETRSWSTNYRGPLFIHAAKGFPRACKDLCFTYPFSEVLAQHGIEHFSALPIGQVVARVELADCISTGWLEADCQTSLVIRDEVNWDNSNERHFGDYGPNRFAWLLRNVRALDAPIPAKGALGLWSPTAELLEVLS